MHRKRFLKQDMEDDVTYEKKQFIEQDVIYDYDESSDEESGNEENKINMVKKMLEFNKIERKQKRA
ncbi:hypothetical protein SAMN02746089_01264 [Caldanaerobius fijiensis DSM 17918]|uniref:Uncharacterized protein n=1 Tax=Caldanaerobius fijiensis DSM 17918 TaxID=1121256 RepID=A0A1M4YQN1_9THEO|nr:hypothetical protein [Caldanaerobius fijiensis]SHF07978.1 hypothetical protein SAMN02746089_01264 [Caldanaerobius fijiensis DSM 17918]